MLVLLVVAGFDLAFVCGLISGLWRCLWVFRCRGCCVCGLCVVCIVHGLRGFGGLRVVCFRRLFGGCVLCCG